VNENGSTNGFGNAIIQNNNFMTAFNAGYKSELVGGISGGIIGGLTSGIQASLTDRNFFTGDANLYNVDPHLLASATREVGIKNGEYSLINNSGSDVYYKPEDGLYGMKFTDDIYIDLFLLIISPIRIKLFNLQCMINMEMKYINKEKCLILPYQIFLGMPE
jgi:hypothetical protein